MCSKGKSFVDYYYCFVCAMLNRSKQMDRWLVCNNINLPAWQWAPYFQSHTLTRAHGKITNIIKSLNATSFTLKLSPIVVVTCGQEVSFLEFDFENPEYPEQIANDSSHCQLTVSHDCEVPICQVRLVMSMQLLHVVTHKQILTYTVRRIILDCFSFLF